MQIDYLPEFPELLNQLAPYLYKEWGHHNGEKSVEDRIRFMAPRMTSGGVPTCFVAHEGGEALGTVSLIEDDFEIRPQYTPWLASLYVLPNKRKLGVGKGLMGSVEEEAARLGIKTLYLTTEDKESYYEKQGWTTIEHAENHGRLAAIMMKEIVIR